MNLRLFSFGQELFKLQSTWVKVAHYLANGKDS